jgi:beta-glucanase (GH16 family)
MGERRARWVSIAWSAAAVVAIVGPGPAAAVGSAPATSRHVVPPGWILSFDEQFEASTLDPGTWATCYWWDNGGCTNEGNDELQWYMPEQVQVGDGVLRLRAEPRGIDAPDGNHYDFVSGMVTTGRAAHDFGVEPRFAFTYAHIEVRARVPAGSGLWPAVWLLPTTHQPRPEIDIMEVRGDATERLLLHVHFDNQQGERDSLRHVVDVADLSAGWHTISLTWSAGELTWGLDGQVLWRVDDPAAVPDEPMYLIANLAVGGELPGPPTADTEFPAELSIDSVRIWQPA